MSEKSERVSEELYAYLAARTSQEDAFLAALKAAARKEEIPNIWISPEQASLMQILLELKGAKEVIEVGTLAGYSAITMARALGPEGRVRTLELEDRHADFAERWIADSDVAGRIEVLRGDARQVIAGVPDASADAAFV
ncbi:MAG: O-methyltransferase, partial [Planctomycetota bacterium]